MNVLRVAAIVAWIFAALYAFGWLLAASPARAIGLVAIGLVLAELASVAILPANR